MPVTKEEFKLALDEGRVIITGEMKTRNGWTGFNVYIMRHLDLTTKRWWFQPVKLGSYWSEARQLHHCTAIGTSRTLEIIFGIGYSLGLKFDEMDQNGYQVI